VEGKKANITPYIEAEVVQICDHLVAQAAVGLQKRFDDWFQRGNRTSPMTGLALRAGSCAQMWP